jgi:RNA polymerase sigma-70 factor (ECF subfamily)
MGSSSAAAPGQSGGPRRQDLPTSRSLLARLRAREETAWRECLTLYAPLVARWCLRKGLGEHDAADVAQEVFRKVAGRIEGFRKEAPADSFRGWLCRITHRQIADFFRRGGASAVPPGGTEAMLRLQQHADPCSQQGEEDQETGYLYRRAVEMVRGEFSEAAWQMFWRTAVDGHPATEVAAEMGTTAAAVRQAKSRVLRRLKQAVGDLPD